MNSNSTSDLVVKYSNASTNSSCDKNLYLETATTPTLVVSDTSTGCNNFLSCSDNFSSNHVEDSKRNSCSSIENSTDTTSNKNKRFNFTCLKTTCNNTVEAATSFNFESNNHLFLPLKGYDSAYGSGMESHSENVSPSAYSNDVDECSADDMDHNRELSYINSHNKSPETKKLSTSSSLFSPISPTVEVNSISSEPELGLLGLLKLQPDQHANVSRKTPSPFSLRSSLSFDLSEEENVSNDDCTAPLPLSRKDSQAKARKSWLKLKSVVKWSPFVQSFKKKYPWIQLAGHEGCFQPGKEGSILKKYVAREAKCLEGFASDDILRTFVPAFYGVEIKDHEQFIRMQDLLLCFETPSIMDCKIGIRTYLEDELTKANVNPCLRKDMYKKMIEISPDEPTEEERRLEGVTKPRYMQWREQVSSSSSLGFRIEGVKKSNLPPNKDYKLTKTVDQVGNAFKYFIDNNVVVLEKYIKRLKAMRQALENSDFFQSHEVIGSSLLFVHDSTNLANVWMIDFGKTSRLLPRQKINHRSAWEEGNREDGFLLGMDNMISIFEDINTQLQEK